MEIQIVSFLAPDGETVPRAMGVIPTQRGHAVLLTQDLSIESYTAVRDHLNTQIAKMESERAMMKAMGNQPQPGASH